MTNHNARRASMEEFEAMWAQIGYSPSNEERAALARALPAMNAMSEAEFDATLKAAEKRMSALTPWGYRFFDWLFDTIDGLLAWLGRRLGL